MCLHSVAGSITSRAELPTPSPQSPWEGTLARSTLHPKKEKNDARSSTATHTPATYLVRQGEAREAQRGLVPCPGSHSHGELRREVNPEQTTSAVFFKDPGPVFLGPLA